jgi:hypothetical protein
MNARIGLECIMVVVLMGLNLNVRLAAAQSGLQSSTPQSREQKGQDAPSEGAVAGNPTLVVTETAYLNGQDVCGQIRIFNFSGVPANIVNITDWLEVHFPNNVPPAGLVTGSDLNWFKVADVPIARPAPIPPFGTLNINYCHPLCETADHPRADFLRNVVRVSVATPWGAVRVFPARSGSVRPPTLDCQACCLGDGSCVNSIPQDARASAVCRKEPTPIARRTSVRRPSAILTIPAPTIPQVRVWPRAVSRRDQERIALRLNAAPR